MVHIKLRDVRQAKGFKLVQLAEKAGCSVSFLSEIENGKMCSVEFLCRLAIALNVTLEDLVKYR